MIKTDNNECGNMHYASYIHGIIVKILLDSYFCEKYSIKIEIMRLYVLSDNRACHGYECLCCYKDRNHEIIRFIGQ